MRPFLHTGLFTLKETSGKSPDTEIWMVSESLKKQSEVCREV